MLCHQVCIALVVKYIIEALVNTYMSHNLVNTFSPSCKQLRFIVVVASKEITSRSIYVKASTLWVIGRTDTHFGHGLTQQAERWRDW